MTDLRRHLPTICLTWDDEAPGEAWRRIDGSLLFADVSGFTALTERLSARGRIGAEELVEALNRVVGPMLSVAAERGGDLLKFGGDALLFLFRGPGHALRAADTALDMRRLLRAAARDRTAMGRLDLSMSVGIHSGPVDLLLVGEPTRELFVLGPAAEAVSAAESAAGAGEIALTAGAARELPRGIVRPRADGLLLLTARVPRTTARPETAVSQQRLRDAVPWSRLESLFPRALGRHLDPGPPEPEHRVASIGFIRFTGTGAVLADRGPQALADDVHLTVSLAMAALADEGITLLATDLDSRGSKFFIASGVPQASEDDEGRILRCLQRLARADSPFVLQLGVNRGHVFAAEVGTPTRAAYSAMGDTTNTAARIMSKAGSGVLFSHPSVLEHSRTLFTAAAAGPFIMKGKEFPLQVYDVGDQAGTRDRTDSTVLPLLGRDTEMDTLLQLLRQALAEPGPGAADVPESTVTVTGGTGLGKSRLVRETLAALDDVTVLELRAEPYGVSSAYRMLREPLRRLMGLRGGSPEGLGSELLDWLGEHAPLLVPWAPLVADVVQASVPDTEATEALDPQHRPDRTAESLVALLEAAAPGRLVVTVEDAQWADGASAHLLDRLCTAAADRPWAVVVARRPDGQGFHPSAGPTVALAPLSDDVMARLVVAATAATPLLPHDIDAVVRRAEGNPLFVREVLRVARAVGSFDAVPDSLQAALDSRVDLLEPDARRVLRTAAVLGRSFRREVLSRTLAVEGLGPGASTWSALDDLLVDDGPGRLRFRTGLLRDAAYEGLSFRTRARLHRAAGLAVEALSADLQADAAAMALHFSRSGDHARTWRYARLAAEAARRAYANAEAADQYGLALDASRHLDVAPGDLAEAWGVLGELRELTGQLPGSVDAYRRAVRIASSDADERRGRERSADLLARRARVHERAGEYVTALRVVARSRRVLDGIDSLAAERVRVRLDLLTALVRLGQERPRRARAMALKAVDGARSVDDPEALVQALMAVDHAELYLGMPVSGSHTREALDICRRNGYRPRESIAGTNLGNFAYFAGRWDEAVQWYEASRRVALEAGNAFGAAETDLSLGDVLVSRGEVDRAEEVLRDAVRVLRASGMPFEAAYGDLQLARVALARGRLDDAARQADRLVDAFLGLGHRTTALEAALVGAEVASRAGDHRRALALVDVGVQAAGDDAAALAARASLRRAAALLGLGQVEACRESLIAGLDSAAEQQLPFEEAQLLLVRSRLEQQLGDGSAAAADDARAGELLDGLGVVRRTG